eukprot:575245-Amphidinium_carterae.1
MDIKKCGCANATHMDSSLGLTLAHDIVHGRTFHEADCLNQHAAVGNWAKVPCKVVLHQEDRTS